MKCEDCHYYFEGQFYPKCGRYPKETMAFGLSRCHEFRPKHNCSEFERVVMEKDGKTVYKCVICKQVRIEVNHER